MLHVAGAGLQIARHVQEFARASTQLAARGFEEGPQGCILHGRRGE